MILRIRTCFFALTLLAAVFFAACRTENNTAVNATPTPTVSVVPLETPMAEPSLTPRTVEYASLTLPVIDALLTDETFVTAAQKQLALTKDQVTKLRTVARQETAKLHETETDTYTFTTAEASAQAARTLQEVLGAAKAQAFSKFAFEHWGEENAVASASPTPAASGTLGASPAPNRTALPLDANNVPTDTRVVVNTPAYRMDIFQQGQLIKSYKIGIGYPEFPIPVALRKANTIIFNPTWTPPDEPWVEGSKNVKVGETVPAGSALNPLGPIKIPIGSPSLIHGGKAPAKIGTFASHGCVGLTDAQVQDFAKRLAEVSGTPLSVEQIAQYAQNRTETKNVKLPAPIPVELRYETIVVENGKLHIYRDVYDRNTNTQAELARVLQTYNVSLADLSETERQRAEDALRLMSRAVSSAPTPRPSVSEKQDAPAAEQKKITRTAKGAKEIVLDIAALQGKGYPLPVELSTGAPIKTAAPKTTKAKKK
jgi:lipoprotein-anchoring transpeptidase ErfK/SrfK